MAPCYDVLSWCNAASIGPMSYFSFQPVLHNWYVLSYLWDAAYIIFFAANQKGVAHVAVAADFLSGYLLTTRPS